MSSSIRLTSSGAPDTPPPGYARIFIEEYKNKLHLKMVRPDGTIEVFGTINLPLPVENGGTGIDTIPEIGQFLIGTGSGYRLGNISAGSGINILKTENTFEISTDVLAINFQMPSEFEVNEQFINNENRFIVTKTNQSQNTVYAGPLSPIENVPTFRLLTQSDIPQLSKNKIIDFQEEVQDVIALTFEDSSSILLQYDDNANKLRAFLSDTGVIPGVYGSLTSIPSINVNAQGLITSVTSIPANFVSGQVTDLKETIEDHVGALIKDTSTINAEYNDVLSRLELHVIPESLITTNISLTENTRAPTSQSIKQYVDDIVDAERTARIDEDGLINTKLNTFLQNAPGVLDTIVEIALRFEAIEQSLVTQNETQAQELEDQIQPINSRLDVVESDISTEISTRVEEIDRVYNAITAHRELIELSQQTMIQPFALQHVQQLSHIMPNSVVAFVDRIGIFEDLDFTLADGNPNQVILTLAPEILTILDGSEVLRISYLTKI
jgi:hypothetical protein